MADSPAPTTNDTAVTADQQATTPGRTELSRRPGAASNDLTPADQPSSNSDDTDTSSTQAPAIEEPLRSPPPAYFRDLTESDVSKVQLTTDKPLNIRIIDQVRDFRNVEEQTIRNAAIVLPKLNPERYKTNPNPRYEVVSMEVAAPPNGHPMAKYAVAADGDIVVEGPALSLAKDALTWLCAETMRMVSKEAPRAWDTDEEAIATPNARSAREV